VVVDREKQFLYRLWIELILTRLYPFLVISALSKLLQTKYKSEIKRKVYLLICIVYIGRADKFCRYNVSAEGPFDLVCESTGLCARVSCVRVEGLHAREKWFAVS
jgi:hypothetical protein